MIAVGPQFAWRTFTPECLQDPAVLRSNHGLSHTSRRRGSSAERLGKYGCAIPVPSGRLQKVRLKPYSTSDSCEGTPCGRAATARQNQCLVSGDCPRLCGLYLMARVSLKALW